MEPCNYETIPGLKTANFELPFPVDLERLGKFFRGKNMKTKIKKGQLCANTNDTYIHVSAGGKVKIHSLRRIRMSYYCKRIAGFKDHGVNEK